MSDSHCLGDSDVSHRKIAKRSELTRKRAKSQNSIVLYTKMQHLVTTEFRKIEYQLKCVQNDINLNENNLGFNKALQIPNKLRKFCSLKQH